MRIFDMGAGSKGDIQTLSAKVAWEECDLPDMEVFFRACGEQGLLNVSNYNAFLVACVAPALHCGERRIAVDGEVCPWLVDNLTTMMAYLNHWYWYDHGRRRGDSVKIEAKPHVYHDPARKPRVGAFFSGGVDSFYTLRKNRLTIPEGHPGRINDAIFVHGFDFGNRPILGTEEDAFEYFLKEFEPIARDAKVNIIPVWTNLQLLGPISHDFWNREFMGPAAGAVAHALSDKLTDVLVASSYSIDDLHPYSSHPLIDPRLGSFSLRIHHDAERISRIEKVRSLGDWQVALDHLRVCFSGKPGMLNCGHCGKCIRTKLELLCADKLHSARVFKNGDINVKLILEHLNVGKTDVQFFNDLIHALPKAGHKDLARAVAVKRLQYRLKKIADVRGMLARVDKTIFGGLLKAQYRHLMRSMRH